MFKSLYFLVEGPGPVMDAAKAAVAQHIHNIGKRNEILNELGVTHFKGYREEISSVFFPNEVPAGFVKAGKRAADRGYWRPKAGTPMHARFEELRRLPKGPDLHELLGYDYGVAYAKESEDRTGWRALGHPLDPAGFAWPHQDGPYMLYIPDAVTPAQEYIDKGYTITNGVNMNPQYEGCRRITKNEWDLIVLTHKVNQEKADADARSN